MMVSHLPFQMLPVERPGLFPLKLFSLCGMILLSWVMPDKTNIWPFLAGQNPTLRQRSGITEERLFLLYVVPAAIASGSFLGWKKKHSIDGTAESTNRQAELKHNAVEDSMTSLYVRLLWIVIHAKELMRGE